MTLTVETNGTEVEFEDSVHIQEAHDLVHPKYAVLFDPDDISSGNATEVINEVQTPPAQSMGYVTSKGFVVHASLHQLHPNWDRFSTLEEYIRYPAGTNEHEVVTLHSNTRQEKLCRHSLSIELSSSNSQVLAMTDGCDDSICRLDSSEPGWEAERRGDLRHKWHGKDRGWYFKPHDDRTDDFNIFEHIIWDVGHFPFISDSQSGGIQPGDWVKYREINSESEFGNVRTTRGNRPALQTNSEIKAGVVTEIHRRTDGALKAYSVVSSGNWRHSQIVPKDDVWLLQDRQDCGHAWSSFGIEPSEKME